MKNATVLEKILFGLIIVLIVLSVSLPFIPNFLLNLS